MTTSVIVSSNRPNHEDVLVETLSASGDASTGTRLTDGEQRSFYVHSGATLRITEVAKEPGAPTSPSPETFGTKAVGLAFNPSGDAAVTNIKEEFAACIERMHQYRTHNADPEVKRMASLAITAAQEAQMWAVKAVTWKA